MANNGSFDRSSRRWRAAYHTAILETNNNWVVTRISAAEEAIIVRTRELFNESGPDVDVERDELDDALYALRAFRNTVENRAA